jgi:photosystem II stability/assembly factor-like uncharacterized protein
MKSYRILLIVIFLIFSLLDLSHEFKSRSDIHINRYAHQRSPASEYFKDWYAPYDQWTPEMQNRAFEQIKQLPNDEMKYIRDKNGNFVTASTYPWVQDGPFGMQDAGEPLRYYSGRITTIDYHPSIGLVVGAASGGLWIWNGVSFLPKSDKLSSVLIGAVAINPSHPNTIFLGTGEYQETKRNGTGVYRSTDGGEHWSPMPLNPTPERVSKIFIFTLPENFVLVATNRGIYRSTDNGDTWNRVLAADVSDISNSPGDFMLAGVNGVGVYKSINWGLNWFPITNDLPTSDIGRVSVACAPNNIYKAYVQIGKASTKGGLGIYKTTNDGSNWTNVTPLSSELSGNKGDYLAQQGYNNVIIVHPTNSDIVWAGGIFLMRTSNGGDTWKDVGATGAKPRIVHTDIHALYYMGSGSLIVGCDGGIFETDDEGLNWHSNYNRYLPITQFYNTDIERNGGRTKAGGAQDNGSSTTTINEPDRWIMYLGGDGVEGVINQNEPTMTFGETNDGDGNPNRLISINSMSTIYSINNGIDPNDIGQTFWHTYLVHNQSSNQLFTNAGDYMYFSADLGSNWSRMNKDPFNGIIDLHFDVNTSAEFVYVPVENFDQRLMKLHRFFSGWEVLNISNGLPADRVIKRVHASRFYPSRVFAITNGVGDSLKIFLSDTYGESWINITGTLPDVPVNDICEDFNNSHVVYAGTDMGVFRCADVGITANPNWSHWNSGMPEAVRVMDMEYVFNPGGDYIFAGTYGRSNFHRPVIGTEPHFELSRDLMKFASVLGSSISIDCVYVKNIGNDVLEIESAGSRDTWIRVNPTSATIAPQESLKFLVYLYPPGKEAQKLYSSIEFVHNGAGSPAILSIEGYVGDATMFRSFSAESLIVKKEIKRKTSSTSWCFRFDNNYEMRNPANALNVQFKNPVIEFISTSPFERAECIDGKGKLWKFSGGSVSSGYSASICGRTSKKKVQLVNKWWWTADLVVWSNDVESTVEGILGSVQGKKSPEEMGPEVGMPNAANFRNEIFTQAPFSKAQPLIVGVADPDAKVKKIAYVALSKQTDLYGSLTTGKSMIFHQGPARYFDYYDNTKEMIGKINKLKPDKQSNRLFAELLALKLNIYGSALGITPVGFGELKYMDPLHRLNGLMVREIDSLANIYMTYGDSSAVGSAVELDSVIYKINRAFVGPLDTISFATGLEFTGVKPVAEVTFLVRDPSVISRKIEHNQKVLEDIAHFELSQNYPNPFNPVTTISFELPDVSLVTLKIYNVLGQEVATLINREMMDEGMQEVDFDASNLASGVYLYQLVADALNDNEQEIPGRTYTAVKKMMVVK